MEKNISAQRILRELGAIAFARATELLTVKDGALTVGDTAELSEELQCAVAAVEKSPGGIKVKFYDKLKALELLGKHLGMFAGTGQEVEDNNLLEAILRATGEEETDDLQPIQHQAADGDQLVEPAEFAEF